MSLRRESLSLTSNSVLVPPSCHFKIIPCSFPCDTYNNCNYLCISSCPTSSMKAMDLSILPTAIAQQLERWKRIWHIVGTQHVLFERVKAKQISKSKLLILNSGTFFPDAILPLWGALFTFTFFFFFSSMIANLISYYSSKTWLNLLSLRFSSITWKVWKWLPWGVVQSVKRIWGLFLRH